MSQKGLRAEKIADLITYLDGCVFVATLKDPDLHPLEIVAALESVAGQQRIASADHLKRQSGDRSPSA